MTARNHPTDQKHQSGHPLSPLPHGATFELPQPTEFRSWKNRTMMKKKKTKTKKEEMEEEKRDPKKKKWDETKKT